MRDPYQWAPRAPAIFALAHRVGGGGSSADFRVSAAYWAQAITGTLLIGVDSHSPPYWPAARRSSPQRRPSRSIRR